MVVTLENRLVVGDETALLDLFDQYSSLLSTIGEEVLGADRSALVGEATADVFAIAWLSRSSFDPSKGSVRSWLVAKMRTRLAGESGVDVLTTDATHGAMIDRHLVASVIDSMPEARSDLLRRGLFGGESEKRMAEHLDVPVATVAGHLRVGLETLRDELVGSLPPGIDVMERLQQVVQAGQLEYCSVPTSPEVWEMVLARISPSTNGNEEAEAFEPATSPSGLTAAEWVSGFDADPTDAQAKEHENAWGVFMSTESGGRDRFFNEFEAGSVPGGSSDLSEPGTGEESSKGVFGFGEPGDTTKAAAGSQTETDKSVLDDLFPSAETEPASPAKGDSDLEEIRGLQKAAAKPGDAAPRLLGLGERSAKVLLLSIVALVVLGIIVASIIG